MAKTRKKTDSKFEKSVKPYYHPSDDCFIVYSPDKKLSLDGDFRALQVKNVKEQLGFELLCSDLLKSTNETFEYHKKTTSLLYLPKVLKFEDTKKLPDTNTNTNEIFILHKTSSKIGFSIASGTEIKKNTVIAEYIGERIASYSKVTDDTYVYISNGGATNIDAKNYGSVARFFNHCPHEHPNKLVLTANVAAVEWSVSKTLTKMFLITLRDIKTFEPICWDYGPKYHFNQEVVLLDVNTYTPINDHVKNEFVGLAEEI